MNGDGILGLENYVLDDSDVAFDERSDYRAEYEPPPFNIEDLFAADE